MRPLLGAGRTTRRLALAAVVIAANWTLYIWGVNHHHVVETSLGYFINPVVTVMIGVLVLRERLRPAQWVAIGLGLLAVVVLTVDYGRPPWIALGLAFSFATYGLIKK
jgi:chloramphenicol-sensitive protein RarD